jgi:hypothetical protein
LIFAAISIENPMLKRVHLRQFLAIVETGGSPRGG